MPDTITASERIIWTQRFRAYTDAMLLRAWGTASEEPGEVDEILLAEIERRNLDF